MPLAADFISSPAPGAPVVRNGAAAAPERMGAAGAFDALLGGAVDADARPAGAQPAQSVNLLPSAQRDVAQREVGFSADLADQGADGAVADIVVAPQGAPSQDGAGSAGQLFPPAMNDVAWAPAVEGFAAEGLAQTPAGPELVQPETPSGTDADTPAGASPELQMNAGAPRPAQPDTLIDRAVKADADRAPAVRTPDEGEQPVSLEPAERDGAGAQDAARTPAPAPEKALMPDAAPAEEPRQSEASAFKAVISSAPPAQTDGQPAPALQLSDGAPQPDTELDPEAAAGGDAKAADGSAEAAPAPVPEAPSNAAPVRRDADLRRTAKSADQGKPGDEPARAAPSGAKAQAPSAPQASAPSNPGAADLPAPPRSAEAFQALLQAQTRPGGETAAPRAPELPSDTSGDAALRSSPDRAAELMRSSAPVNTGAAPRFAPQTVQTLAAQIVRRQGEGGRVFDIRLDPPELGRVGVRLEMGKDQMVKAMLSAERPDTLQELQRTARDLERALADAGFNLAENGLSFTLGGEGGERDAPGSDTPRGAGRVVDIDVARPGAPAAALYGFALARTAGLDIQA